MVLIAHKSVRLPRRSILGAAAACVPALAALTACAGTNRAFNSATSTPAASAASRIETSAATSVARAASSAVPATQAPATGAARLTFETWGSIDEIKVRQNYTQQFVKDHPAIDVTFTPTPQDYWNALQSRMAGGNAPDVYYLEPGHVVELHCRNALLALDPYLARDHFDINDFYPAGPLEYTIDGKLWALNRDFANQDIFYNVDLFKKAGVPLPPKQFDAAGWTFDDFLAACQKLTAGSGSSQTYGFGVPHGWRAYMSFVWSDGGTLVSQDALKPTIDQPNAVTGLQFLEDLVGKYKVAPTPAETKAQSINNLFYAGRLGMM